MRAPILDGALAVRDRAAEGAGLRSAARPRFRATNRSPQRNPAAAGQGPGRRRGAHDRGAHELAVAAAAARRPLGLFWVGPTGVGKTELARAISLALFESRERAEIIPFGEVSNEHRLNQVIGAPPGTIGSDEVRAFERALRNMPTAACWCSTKSPTWAKILPRATPCSSGCITRSRRGAGPRRRPAKPTISANTSSCSPATTARIISREPNPTRSASRSGAS